jgi:hypothetical protein
MNERDAAAAEAGLVVALANDPGDTVAALALADLYQETGWNNIGETALRYMSDNRVAPFWNGVQWLWFSRWSWMDRKTGPVDAARLEPSLFARLQGGESLRASRAYDGMWSAILALGEALESKQPEKLDPL